MKIRPYSFKSSKPPRGSSIDEMADFYTREHEMDSAIVKGIEDESIMPKGAKGVCVQCMKVFEWREQLETQGYTSMMFCSIECMMKSQSRWSRLCRWVHDEIGCRFIWRPYYHVQKWWYARKCPFCHVKMMVMLPELQTCDNDPCFEFGTTFEIDFRKRTAKRV